VRSSVRSYNPRVLSANGCDERDHGRAQGTCWNWRGLACPGTVSLPNSGRSPMTGEGREGRNRSGVEAAMPGRLRGDERSARSSRTGIHRIGTSGKVIATLAAIVTVGQCRPPPW
jgi:hypothetical protein